MQFNGLASNIYIFPNVTKSGYMLALFGVVLLIQILVCLVMLGVFVRNHVVKVLG